MSILGAIFGNLIGGATASGVATAANGLGDAAIKIRQAITNDITADKKAEIELELVKIEAAAALAQTEVNKIEAASGSLFVAGWRPAIGWVCAGALAFYYWPRVLLGTGLWFYMSLKAGVLLPPPEMGITDILGLVGSMLGFGWLRTKEKEKGVAR